MKDCKERERSCKNCFAEVAKVAREAWVLIKKSNPALPSLQPWQNNFCSCTALSKQSFITSFPSSLLHVTNVYFLSKHCLCNLRVMLHMFSVASLCNFWNCTFEIDLWNIQITLTEPSAVMEVEGIRQSVHSRRYDRMGDAEVQNKLGRKIQGQLLNSGSPKK